MRGDAKPIEPTRASENGNKPQYVSLRQWMRSTASAPTSAKERKMSTRRYFCLKVAFHRFDLQRCLFPTQKSRRPEPKEGDDHYDLDPRTVLFEAHQRPVGHCGDDEAALRIERQSVGTDQQNCQPSRYGLLAAIQIIVASEPATSGNSDRGALGCYL